MYCTSHKQNQGEKDQIRYMQNVFQNNKLPK